MLFLVSRRYAGTQGIYFGLNIIISQVIQYDIPCTHTHTCCKYLSDFSLIKGHETYLYNKICYVDQIFVMILSTSFNICSFVILNFALFIASIWTFYRLATYQVDCPLSVGLFVRSSIHCSFSTITVLAFRIELFALFVESSNALN